MERRGRLRLAAIVAAIALTAGTIAIVTYLQRRSASPFDFVTPASAVHGDPAAPRSFDDNSPSSDQQAERTPLQTLPPPRAGMVRYHARLVASDGKPHSYYMSEATPSGSSVPQTLPPTKKGDVTVDAPAECRAVDFTSKGFVAVHHTITQRELERLDLGSIVFVPATRLEIEILHAPRNEKAWLDLSAFAKVEVQTGWGDQIGFGHDKFATPDGEARRTYFVPSDTEIRLSMSGDGVCFRRVIPSLPAGTTDYPIDFAQIHSLHGRVVGVPLACAKGMRLWLGSIRSDRDGLFPGMDVQIPLDEKGAFLLPVIPEGAFDLRLDASYLREAGGAHRDWWQTEAVPPEQELVVEPIEPLFGLEVGPIDGSTPDERSTQISFAGPPPSFFWSDATGDPPFARGLIRAASLDRSTGARVQIGGGRGNVRELVVPAHRIPRPHDQIVTIRLDELKRATASLTVSLPLFASRDWTLMLVKAGGQPYSTSDPESVRRERGLFSFTFSDLEAGKYDVIASIQRSRFRRVVRDLTLGEGESVSVDVPLPDPTPIGGRITNWNDIPAALRPVSIAIDLDSSDRIADGRFTIRAVHPIDGVARFFFGPTEQYVDVTANVETRADGTLAVAYPVNDVELFVLEANVPDATHVYATVIRPPCPDTFEPGDDLRNGHRVGADPHGTMSILSRRGQSVRGWVNESSRSGVPHILAWFSSDVPPGTIVPDGRYVEVDNAADGTAATVVMVPRKVSDWQPPRIPLFKVFAGISRHLWLPAGAEFLDVEFPGRPRDRVPAASIGAQWTIAPR